MKIFIRTDPDNPYEKEIIVGEVMFLFERLGQSMIGALMTPEVVIIQAYCSKVFEPIIQKEIYRLYPQREVQFI